MMLVKRLSLAAENTILLFLPAAIVGCLLAYFDLEGPLWLRLIVVAAVPALACIILEVLVLIWPVLVGWGQYTLWTCLMVPLMHVSIVAACAAIATVSPSGLLSMRSELEPVSLWLWPLTLVLAFVTEAMLFTVVHLRRQRRSHESVASS